jgi:YbbR domain-containing protein
MIKCFNLKKSEIRNPKSQIQIVFMLFSTEKFFQNERPRAVFGRLFRKIFLDDWVMKLIALVITLALWLGVSGLRAPTTERLRGVALNIRVSNDIEVTNSPVAEVDIVVTGDKSRIESINERNLVASLDLTDVQAGERTVQITPENVNIELPIGVKLEEIQPNKIAVRLERVEEREIPVKAETEGTLADGFEIYGETVLPPTVRVRAPESYIRTLDFISTEKINIENRQNDFTAQQVSLNVVNPKATLLDTVVDVAFRVGEKRIERLFLVPVKTEVGDKKATVVLYGARSVFENLSSENLQVELVRSETGENSLRLVLPPEIQNRVEIRRLKLN